MWKGSWGYNDRHALKVNVDQIGQAFHHPVSYADIIQCSDRSGTNLLQVPQTLHSTREPVCVLSALHGGIDTQDHVLFHLLHIDTG